MDDKLILLSSDVLTMSNKAVSTESQPFCPHCYTENSISIDKEFRDYVIRCKDCENHFNFPYEALDSPPTYWQQLKNRFFG